MVEPSRVRRPDEKLNFQGQTAMMMKKFETLRRIVDSGLVAVIRADSADQAIQLAEACHKGGVAAIVKLFPGELFGPSAIRAIRGPLPQANLLPTGGVNLDNVSDWIKAGAVGVAVGGALTGPAKPGDMQAVTKTARKFLEKIQAARLK